MKMQKNQKTSKTSKTNKGGYQMVDAQFEIERMIEEAKEAGECIAHFAGVSWKDCPCPDCAGAANPMEWTDLD